MISVSKSTKKNPSCLSNQDCINSLKKVCDTSDPEHKKNIKPSVYGDKEVYQKLKNLYHNKCAYCETFEPEPEIEHYRPKKQINGVARSEHKGYYWLAYEWTNLLPACHDCNKNGVKGNHFPIEGTRRYNLKENADGNIDLSANNLMSDYLQAEKALFLNPETPDFNPFFYFKFNSVGRFLPSQPKDSFEYRQADKTIDIVQLNRDKLFLNYRKNKIRGIFKKVLKQIYKDFLKGECDESYFKKQVFRVLNNIVESAKPHQEYSFFWSYLYEHFGDYILSYFEGNHRLVFLKFYKEHKSSHL